MSVARALATALVALLLAWLGYWFATSTEWVDEEDDAPLRGEAARNPWFAAQELVRKLGGVAVDMPNLDQLPPPDATLWLSSPHWDLFPQRGTQLRNWVEQQGGHLVVPAGDLRHRLPWVPMAPDDSDTTAVPAAASAPADTTLSWPEQATPPRTCVKVHESLHSQVLYPDRSGLDLCGARSGSGAVTSTASAAWAVLREDHAQLMRVRSGRGSVTALTVQAAFENRALLQGDNGLLLAGALSLRPGRVVWFVTGESREALPTVMWHWAPPAWLLAAAAVALALWRAAVRFGPPAPDAAPARRSVAEQVRGTARFVWQRQSSALLQAQQLALHATAHSRIPRYDQLDTATRAAALARLTRLPPALLASALGPASTAPRRLQTQSLALLETARRRLLRPDAELSDPPKAHP